MAVHKLLILMLSALLLASCGSGKEPQYYVLNPANISAAPVRHTDLNLGIEDISIPEYLDKPQLMIFLTPNQSAIDDNHQWAEELSNNIRRVITTNLQNFLPGALVELKPWNNKFEPNYYLQINISQFKVDTQGNSILQASYVFYDKTHAIRQFKASYCQKLLKITPDAIVASMNNNLTRLCRDIAKNTPK
ncbi:membrane integrity-associated transporter subunit PqiC [Legionella dresdenensis]|uniref:Membrane integrity-associated transporter subunit PqiC n=1 Tax=Legionella dresdenensis TaxID=450200 RepID=A0ABV8CFL6_9GAMM